MRNALNAFGKLVRTTAFRLTLVYLLLFALFAGALLGYFAWNTQRLINEQITTTVDADTTELSDIFNRRGIRGIVSAIEYRSLRPGANLYLITTPAGRAVVGNISSFGNGTIEPVGWLETDYHRLDEHDTTKRQALVRVSELSSGFRLMVGRDLEERQRLFKIVASAAQWSLLAVIVLGLGGGVFAARRMLRRVDSMTATTRKIMAGDLSGRLIVGRSGDELDRLAENLNAMLERIEALMNGMREVSDNIAHDLKTPLTRLRNRAEAALACAATETDYREALEQTIEESDGLIRTFNALLMIARAESGHADGNFAEFDVEDMARGIHELYEPLAEDNGQVLLVEISPLKFYGNRELISQALANLVENAIKYGRQDDPATAPSGANDILIKGEVLSGQLQISVTDRGVGIPVDEREHAIERFARLEASRTKPGSGLGLSLAAAVATLHGGALVLGDAGPGLRATLELPVKTGEALAVQTENVSQITV